MVMSDLWRLKREVLDQEPEAALPRNLSDEWLGMLARDLEMFPQEQDESHSYLSAPLAIVIHILRGKHGDSEKEIAVSEEELFEYLRHLRIEIALELVCRNTNIAGEAATIETIFTSRVA